MIEIHTAPPNVGEGYIVGDKPGDYPPGAQICGYVDPLAIRAIIPADRKSDGGFQRGCWLYLAGVPQAIFAYDSADSVMAKISNQ